MKPGKVYMESPSGQRSWVEARKVRGYLDLNKGYKVVDRVRMKVDAPGGPVVREFNGGRVPAMWQDSGEVMGPDDTTQNTPVGTALANNAMTAAAGLPGIMAQAAPMAIPGTGLIPAGLRLATAFGAGTAADASSRAIMGQEQDPGSSMMAGGVNALWQSPFEAAAMVPGMIARPWMRSAFGNAKPGIEDIALARKQEVSTAGYRTRAKAVRKGVDDANALIDSSPRTYSWRVFDRAVRGEVTRARRGDLLSDESERALNEARKVLANKIGPAVTRTPASKILGPNGQPATAASKTVGPERPMTARDVDDIRSWADNQAKALHKARSGEGDKKVGDLENAYMTISKTANKMLRATIPGLRQTRQTVSEDIDLRKALFDTLKRATPKPANPMGALMQLGQSPTGLSRSAIRLNDPFLPDAIRTVPRVLGVAAADALSRNNRQ